MNLQYSLRNNTSYDAYPWFYYYTLVGQANTIIARIDDATGEESMKKLRRLRHSHSVLTASRSCCTTMLHAGRTATTAVPRVSVCALMSQQASLPQATMAECYAQIYKDLDEAITLFQQSGMNRGTSEIWIANENVAHAVYARAALAKQDYQTALTHAPLARKGYALMSNADYYAGFCKPTSEWIFGSYGDAQENMWYWSLRYTVLL